MSVFNIYRVSFYRNPSDSLKSLLLASTAIILPEDNLEKSQASELQGIAVINHEH